MKIQYEEKGGGNEERNKKEGANFLAMSYTALNHVGRKAPKIVWEQQGRKTQGLPNLSKGRVHQAIRDWGKNKREPRTTDTVFPELEWGNAAPSRKDGRIGNQCKPHEESYGQRYPFPPSNEDRSGAGVYKFAEGVQQGRGM